MDAGLTGKVAMISGGSRGIGRATADILAAEGVALSLGGRNAESLAQVAREIENRYRVDCATFSADLTSEGAVARWVEHTVERFGTIDILVNNASGTRNTGFADATPAVWMEELRLKLLGYIELSSAVFPIMKKRGGGAIVSVIGASAKQPVPSRMVGNVAGAGLVSFTKALSDQGAPHHIRVNAVSPGYTNTHRWAEALDFAERSGVDRQQAAERMLAQIPMGRLAEPEDVANAILFLSSAKLAGYITGVTLDVDGGYLRCI